MRANACKLKVCGVCLQMRCSQLRPQHKQGTYKQVAHRPEKVSSNTNHVGSIRRRLVRILRGVQGDERCRSSTGKMVHISRDSGGRQQEVAFPTPCQRIGSPHLGLDASAGANGHALRPQGSSERGQVTQVSLGARTGALGKLRLRNSCVLVAAIKQRPRLACLGAVNTEKKQAQGLGLDRKTCGEAPNCFKRSQVWMHPNICRRNTTLLAPACTLAM